MTETVEGKKKGWAKKIEMAANIGIVITAALVVIFFVRNYTQRHNDPQRTVALGSKFALKNVDWQTGGKNLVFAVSTTCHYCTESAPFYRKLVEQCKQQHVHTVAVLPQTPAEAQAYLAGEGVTVDEIRQAPLSDLDIAGTPTLVLVDHTGIVKNVWVGKLPSAKEDDVVTTLGQTL
ncbi:MAG TPA: redoxin family protein [Candidatus Angelobacter sp.]|jgi:peroxiredoxin